MMMGVDGGPEGKESKRVRGHGEVETKANSDIRRDVTRYHGYAYGNNSVDPTLLIGPGKGLPGRAPRLRWGWQRRR